MHRSRAVRLVADPEAEGWADGPRAPYAAVEADRAGSGPLRAGLGEVWAEHDRGRVRLVAHDTDRAARRVRLPVGGTLGFVLGENRATVLVRRRPGGRWRPVLSSRVDDVAEHRDPAVLARQGWRDAGPAGGDVRRGPFGAVGLRDPHLVTWADGSAYERDGRVFLTMTCAGPGGFRQGHWGVFALDPQQPQHLEQVATIFFRRDGLVFGDHAGQLVRDGDRWLVAVSSWGDFSTRRGAHVRSAASTDDLLRGVHVLDSEPVTLPTPEGTVATWDPCLVRDGEGWLVGHVEATSLQPMRFRPALARTTGADPFAGLQRVAGVGPVGQTEGPVLVRRGGRVWLLVSDGAARRYRVADPASGQEVGALDAPYPSNIPHPQLLERRDGSWLMVTFDGTRLERRRRRTGRRPVLGYGTHGDLVVLQAPAPR